MPLLFAVITSLALLLPVRSADGSDLILRLSLIQGDVQVAGRDIEDWSGAAINMPLAEGDRVWVADDSRAELQLPGGFFIRLDGESSLDAVSLNDGSLQFYADRGHAYVNNISGGVSIVQLDTPLASVRSYDDSIMTIDVAEDGGTEISVLKGAVYAESRAGSTRVSAGMTLAIEEDGAADLSPIGPQDEWEEWNLERDRQVLAWGESSRYLPEELHAYSSDLDAYGSWVFATDYGWCWTPVVSVADWAPYTVGRWGWFRGNYVWISSEPWGWVPYHYGRWVFAARFGWCWVPPLRGMVFWGPAWVGWIITPTVYAWVPLAPGELYYGYGDFGPGSVNLVNVNINIVVIKRNYKNARVRNSVTVLGRDEFEKGRWRPRHVGEDRENPFLGGDHGKEAYIPPRDRPARQYLLPAREHRPEVRQPPERRERMEPARGERRAAPPVKERREGAERHIAPPPASTGSPAHRQPPERVQRTRPEEIRRERRVVKERDASVFSPGRRPAELPVTERKEPRMIFRKHPEQQQSVQPKIERRQIERREQRERKGTKEKQDRRRSP